MQREKDKKNFIKNTPLRMVFPTLFSVFGYPDETQSLVFDILLKNKHALKYDRGYYVLT